MEERAGKKGEAQLSIEELLQQAQAGWSKFSPYADDIDRLVTGGVRQKNIETWLAGTHGVKCARGELSHWLTRRRNQRAKLGQASAPAPTRAPVSTPTTQARPSTTSTPALPTPADAAPSSSRPMRRPDERSGTSAEELDMDAKVAAAIAKAEANKGRRPQRRRE